MKTDAQIQHDVLNELTWDTRVSPTEVGVAVENSVVTLTGTVASWAKKLAAEEAAHRVVGVHDVANDLEIRLPHAAKRTDTEIAAAIRQALLWDVLVPEDRIQTTVANGTVTLRGSVDYASQRIDTARAIQNLAGVMAIDNKIVVKTAVVSKPALQTAIHDALERHADRHAEKIKLDIEAGRVTLSGPVHTWSERKAVVDAVWGTRGVEIVVDRLRIAP